MNKYKNIDFDFEPSKPLSFWQRKIPMWILVLFLAIAAATLVVLLASNIIQLRSSEKTKQLQESAKGLEALRDSVIANLNATNAEIARVLRSLNDKKTKQTWIITKSISGEQEIFIHTYSSKRNVNLFSDSINVKIKSQVEPSRESLKNSYWNRQFDRTDRITLKTKSISRNGLALVFVKFPNKQTIVEVVDYNRRGEIITF